MSILLADFSADAVGWSIIIAAIANAWILISNRKKANADAEIIKTQNVGIITQVGELETKVNGTVEKAVAAALKASGVAVTAGEARGNLEGRAEIKAEEDAAAANLEAARKELFLPGNGHPPVTPGQKNA